MSNVSEIITKHVTLEVECVDPMNLNAYIPRLQCPGQLMTFLQRRGFVIPSPKF
jgi:hypothetical protein